MLDVVAQQVVSQSPTGLRFDWTISFGNIIQLITFLFVLIRLVNRALGKITTRMKAMERRVDMMWAWIFINLTPEQVVRYEAWETQYKRRDLLGEDD